jgi:signal transduction histidine kinase
MRRDGEYFGTLCALDPEPATLTDEDLDIFYLLAQLIAFELEADERQQQQELERRALEDIITIAAHDLRQPLTAVHGRAQLVERRLLRGRSAAELLPDVRMLIAHSDESIQLTDTLLDVARIEAGAMELRARRFDLVSLANEIIAEARSTSQRHVFALDAPQLLQYFGDERRIGQVLRNIVGNAIKYAPPENGPVEVSIGVEGVGSPLPRATIIVRDHGIGVSEDDLPHLFRRHFRAETATTRGIRGSGLGLFITRSIVNAHGGKINVSPTAGGGLTVTVILPIAAESPPSAASDVPDIPPEEIGV